MPLGMLANVQRGQVKAEDLDAADQVGQLALGCTLALVLAQAVADDLQILQKLIDVCYRRAGRADVRPRDADSPCASPPDGDTS